VPPSRLAPKTITPKPAPHPEWESDDWCTPEEVLALVYQLGDIALDPCSNPWSRVKARQRISRPDNGLAVDWLKLTESGDLIWVNPPFSSPRPWVEACARAGAYDRRVLLLAPVATTQWAHLALAACQRVCVWKGRIDFLRPDAAGIVAAAGSPNVEPWLFYFGPEADAFTSIFWGSGTILKRAA
jgi:hypothetical protein